MEFIEKFFPKSIRAEPYARSGYTTETSMDAKGFTHSSSGGIAPRLDSGAKNDDGIQQPSHLLSSYIPYTKFTWFF